METELFKALEGGAVLLTANNRLSRHLRRVFDDCKISQGLEVWESADILPFPAWLKRVWEEGIDAGLPEIDLAGWPSLKGAVPRLLSAHQELAVWEGIIGADAEVRGLLRPSALADLAMKGWKLAREWGPVPEGKGEQPVEEFRAFLRWRKRFSDQCAEKGWVSGAALTEVIAGWYREGRLKPPDKIYLAGFDEFTPQQSALWEALRDSGREKGSMLEEVPPPFRRGQPVLLGCQDLEDEIRAAARWIRGLLESGQQGPIGVVAPDLSSMRNRILRIFSDEMIPAAILPGRRSEAPFNISQGPPLSHYPLVEAAIALLEMGRQNPPFEKLSLILRSPFLAGAETERQERGLLEVRLREFGQLELSPATVIREAKNPQKGDRPSPFHCPALAGCWEKWQEKRRAVRGLSQPPSLWARDFSLLLEILGWPGERGSDGVEYQTRIKFQEIFTKLAELDLVTPRISYGDALSRLKKLAGSQTFQPESREEQIQILGILEAGGISFDHLWVLGMHDGVWPSPPQPNPFLPVGWQRARNLPRSSALRELEYARLATRRLTDSAEEVVFSYPQRDGETELRPSPLLAGLPSLIPPLSGNDSGAASERLLPSPSPSLMEIVNQSDSLERFEDHGAPPLPEGEAVKGGTALFKDQAACPFRAFAFHRLQARPLESPSFGPGAAERGDLVHQALEKFWSQLGSSAELSRMQGEGSLPELTNEVVSGVLEEYKRKHPGALGENFATIEKERISRLVGETLLVDLERPSFSVIGRELAQTFSIGGIEVNTRIDRLDQVADGRHVVIDYKTGKPSVQDWFGPRPNEPQLPLYCSSGGIDLAAVAFLQIRRGDTRFRGLEGEKGIIPRADLIEEIAISGEDRKFSSRQEMLEEWKSALENLALEFRRGNAEVNPKNPEKTCTYCGLQLLCRIHELKGWPEPDLEEGADD